MLEPLREGLIVLRTVKVVAIETLVIVHRWDRGGLHLLASLDLVALSVRAKCCGTSLITGDLDLSRCFILSEPRLIRLLILLNHRRNTPFRALDLKLDISISSRRSHLLLPLPALRTVYTLKRLDPLLLLLRWLYCCNSHLESWLSHAWSFAFDDGPTISGKISIVRSKFLNALMIHILSSLP